VVTTVGRSALSPRCSRHPGPVGVADLRPVLVSHRRGSSVPGDGHFLPALQLPTSETPLCDEPAGRRGLARLPDKEIR